MKFRNLDKFIIKQETVTHINDLAYGYEAQHITPKKWRIAFLYYKHINTLYYGHPGKYILDSNVGKRATIHLIRKNNILTVVMMIVRKIKNAQHYTYTYLITDNIIEKFIVRCNEYVDNYTCNYDYDQKKYIYTKITYQDYAHLDS